MRNLKKMAALGAAAVMALSMNVSSFAAATGTAKASYSGGKVLLSSLADIDATHQWTVVVIGVADQNANLTADKLYYINQGTSGDAFWTDGMGTKTELAAGDYIVRIGGETIDTTDKLIEIPLKVTSGSTGKTITVKWGDITGDGSVDSGDALAALLNRVGVQESYNIDEYTVNVGDTFGGYVWGDITGDGSVDSGDALAALLNRVGVQESYSMNGTDISVGADVNITIAQN